MKMTLETARALQEQNRRRPGRQGSERRERRKNSPTEKAKGPKRTCVANGGYSITHRAG
jgi:hypothetical protein